MDPLWIKIGTYGDIGRNQMDNGSCLNKGPCIKLWTLSNPFNVLIVAPVKNYKIWAESRTLGCRQCRNFAGSPFFSLFLTKRLTSHITSNLQFTNLEHKSFQSHKAIIKKLRTFLFNDITITWTSYFGVFFWAFTGYIKSFAKSDLSSSLQFSRCF